MARTKHTCKSGSRFYNRTVTRLKVLHPKLQKRFNRKRLVDLLDRKSGMKKVSDELRQVIQCGVCFQIPKNAKVLPCMNTACLECLEKSYTSEQQCLYYEYGQYSCPVCDELHTLDDCFEEDLPTDSRVDEIQGLLTKHCAKDDEDIDADFSLCTSCKADGQEVIGYSFCLQCQEHMCPPCSFGLGHKYELDANGHPVVDLVNNGDEARCSIHNLIVSKFCSTCVQHICISCENTQHKGHNFANFIKRNGRSPELENVASMARHMNKVEEELLFRKSQFPYMRESLVGRYDQLKERMRGNIDKMIESLEQQKDQWKCEVEKKMDESLKEIERLEKTINNDLVVANTIQEQLQVLLQPFTGNFDVSLDRFNLEKIRITLKKFRLEPHVQLLGFEENTSALSAEVKPITYESRIHYFETCQPYLIESMKKFTVESVTHTDMVMDDPCGTIKLENGLEKQLT